MQLPGDVVFAPWAEDGFDYEATIDHIDEVGAQMLSSSSFG